MRFVAVRSEESQAAAVIFCTRDLLVRQPTQLINAALAAIWASLGCWSRGGGLGGGVGCIVAGSEMSLYEATRPALQASASALT